jgi:hypothetical protein
MRIAPGARTPPHRSGGPHAPPVDGGTESRPWSRCAPRRGATTIRRLPSPQLCDVGSRPHPDACHGRELRDAPNPGLIEFAACLLAQLAARKGRGAPKSIALSIRNHFADAPKDVQERVRARAKELVALELPEAPLDVLSPEQRLADAAPDWTLRRAAAHLDVHPRTLEQRLRDPRYRRLYGWPWNDGRQWWFRSAALDSRTSARVMAELPEEEPFHLLPGHCDPGTPAPRWYEPSAGYDVA